MTGPTAGAALYLLLFSAAWCVPVARAAAYVHAPWFGDASVFGEATVLSERDLGFASVAMSAKSVTRNPTLSVSVLPSGALRATWADVPHPTADDVLVLTCDHPTRRWRLDEGFDAVRVAGSPDTHGSQILRNRTALPDVRCQYLFGTFKAIKRN